MIPPETTSMPLPSMLKTSLRVSLLLSALFDREGMAVAEVNAGGLLSGWLDNADPEGEIFYGGWVLSRHHRWTRGQDTTPSKDVKQEGLRLATELCTIIDADIGLAAINSGPDVTYMVAVYEDEVYDRTMRFRGYDSHSESWIASMSLDLVRRMCLGLLRQ